MSALLFDNEHGFLIRVLFSPFFDSPKRGGKNNMAEADSEKLYTLSDISSKTGISMPTLQRYKKMYQDRIPSAGQGGKQRSPESGLPVFEEIKVETAGKRGRPRKDASAPRPERPAASKRRPGRPARAAKPAAAAAQPERAPRRNTDAAAAPPGAAAAAVAKRSPGRPRKAAAAAAPSGRRPGRPQKSSGLLTLTQISE